ncbi:MAG TPA: energy transducer TonB [Mucilaginibacter sp.]|nr:energy transducer TonB [Mucilaginibacter sp.]
MKPILITIYFIAFLSIAKAQQATVSPKKADPNADVVIDEPVKMVEDTSQSKIFTSVEQIPMFPGGFEALYKYLTQNIHYPASAVKDKIEGKVFLTFVVEKDGSLTDIKVVRGVSADIDTEALRVLKESPKWQPGTQNSRPVRVQFTVPISFLLQKK